jgi:hypothetical protein
MPIFRPVRWSKEYTNPLTKDEAQRDRGEDGEAAGVGGLRHKMTMSGLLALCGLAVSNWLAISSGRSSNVMPRRAVGPQLKRLAHRGTPLPADEARRIASKIAQGCPTSYDNPL